MKRGKFRMAPVVVERVLAVLGDHRREVVTRARAAGCDLDRWHPQDWPFMAREITRLEDQLELAGAAPAVLAKRTALRDVRRALEGT